MRAAIFGFLFVTSVAHSATAPTSREQDRPDVLDKKEWKKYGGGGGGFVVRYMSFPKDEVSQVFTANGFAEPPSGIVSWGGKGYLLTKTGWQLGGAGYGASTKRTSGAFEASYGVGYGGFHLAKELLDFHPFDLSLGGLVGGGGADIQVFSGGAGEDGQVSESFFFIEPSVVFSWRITSFFKLGLSGSYFVPFSNSTKTKGDDLGVSSLVDRSWTAGLQFIFGKFPEPEGTGEDDDEDADDS